MFARRNSAASAMRNHNNCELRRDYNKSDRRTTGGSYHVTRESREVVAIVSIVHPVFGQALLWFLLLVYAACILVPLIAFLRLPRRLLPPSADDQAAQKVFREKLAKRLRSNRNLTQGDVTSETIERHCPSLARHAPWHRQGAAQDGAAMTANAISQTVALKR